MDSAKDAPCPRCKRHSAAAGSVRVTVEFETICPALAVTYRSLAYYCFACQVYFHQLAEPEGNRPPHVA